jgi:hypothetical protein
MKKSNRPILDGKDRGEVGSFGNKTNKISEIRELLLSGDTIKEKNEKRKRDKKKRLDE